MEKLTAPHHRPYHQAQGIHASWLLSWAFLSPQHPQNARKPAIHSYVGPPPLDIQCGFTPERLLIHQLQMQGQPTRSPDQLKLHRRRCAADVLQQSPLVVLQVPRILGENWICTCRCKHHQAHRDNGADPKCDVAGDRKGHNTCSHSVDYQPTYETTPINRS
jgi:hypothetical protein